MKSGSRSPEDELYKDIVRDVDNIQSRLVPTFILCQMFRDCVEAIDDSIVSFKDLEHVLKKWGVECIEMGGFYVFHNIESGEQLIGYSGEGGLYKISGDHWKLELKTYYSIEEMAYSTLTEALSRLLPLTSWKMLFNTVKNLPTSKSELVIGALRNELKIPYRNNDTEGARDG